MEAGEEKQIGISIINKGLVYDLEVSTDIEDTGDAHSGTILRKPFRLHRMIIGVELLEMP